MEQLARLRELKGFSQRALAKESGVSPATIYELENGRRKPNPSTLRKLASALGVEVVELLGADFPKEESRSSFELTFDDVIEERRNFELWTKLLELKATRWERELRDHEARPTRKTARREIKDPFDHGRASEISQDILELTGFLLNEVVNGLDPKLLSPEERREGALLLAALDRASGAADELLRQATPTPDEWLELSQERHDEWRKQRETAEERRKEIRRLNREIA